MSVRFIATADIHFDQANQAAALASLTTLAETAERERPQFVVIAGDLFNKSVPDTEAAGFPRLLAVLRRIRDVCPILAVYGTPTHDIPGSYAPLEAAGLVRVIDPTTWSPPVAFLCDNGKISVELWSEESPVRPDDGKAVAMILGCPEPTKEWLLAGTSGLSADAANEQVKAAMRSILLGLGAVRAQYPDLPCVMIYHGAVAGASMQNGQVVEGGLTIGREDLELVGADYYALGHIHLAQKIPEIPAYYPGSAYPVNWGELDQKCFNLVTLNKGTTEDPSVVDFRSYPHAPRAKFVVDWPEPVGPAVEGVQAWVVYRATREQLAQIDTDALTEAYLEQGALPGSRVTTELIPTETVRAAEITDKHGLFEKVQVYEEASNGNYLDDPIWSLGRAKSVAAKVEQLEREAAARGELPEGLHIRVRKIRLRGAIGIWKGQHVDEITLDLDNYDEGLIALIGENGAGKTTLLENMHPYSGMLTRDGSLQQHFRLRDSAREIWFTDERTGNSYRALILIDGRNASGSCEYHLFRNDEPLTDGRKASYDEAIDRLFGSLPLFLRSAFVSQKATKNNPDLSEASKGEKKKIFRELAGLDYLQGYADAAKAAADQIERDLETERTRVNLLESQLTALPGIRTDVDGKRAAAVVATSGLDAIRVRGEEAARAVETAAEACRAQTSLRERIASLEYQANQKRQVITTAEELIRGYRTAAERAPAAQTVLDNWTRLTGEESKENARIAEVNAERARLQGEHTARLQAHHEDVRKLEGQQAQLRTEKAHLEGDLNVLRATIESLGAEIANPLTGCPNCGYVDPKREEDRKGKIQRHLDACEQRRALEPQIAAKQKAIDAITLPPAPTPPNLPPVDQAALQRIRGELAGLNVDQARKTLTAAQESAVRIEEAVTRKGEAAAELAQLEVQLIEAGKELDPQADNALANAKKRYEDLRGEYAVAQRELATLEGQIKALETRISELEAQERDLAARKGTMAASARELADWRYLERACGPDGIQALELDAMGPEIADVANRLLSSAYGSRFQIEFRTTRIAGKGAKTKQVEDFSIWILDTEDGTEQELSTLSGGESVWIKRALYDAFGIIRDRNTGTRFLTVFADEADGALDPEAKTRYVTMLQQAHLESGRRHTIVITHSPEAQEQIGQKLRMQDLATTESKEEVA